VAETRDSFGKYVVMATLGEWELRDRQEHIMTRYVAHIGCSRVKAATALAWTTGDLQARCYGCWDTVPDEVQTVMIMLEDL
jgi:hypothetical protein